MGDEEDKNLESRLSRLAKAPLRFLRSYAVPLGVGAGIGAAVWGYCIITKQRAPSLGELKDIHLNWDFWKEELLRWPFYALGVLGAFTGFLALNNMIRKRKGKKPIKILKYLRQSLFPSSISEDKKGYMELLDSYPAPSLTYRGLGNLYFGKGKIIEAMESYYEMIRARDDEVIPKIPILGTNSYVDIISGNIRGLKKRLRDEPDNNQVLLELAMNYFSVYDFQKAVECFERIDKEQDPIGFRILASKFYSEMSKRAKRPKIRRFSFGDSAIGRIADKSIYFWDLQNISQHGMKEKSEKEVLTAVEQIFGLSDLEKHLESIGDYDVYRIGLNRFVKGFVVVKGGRYEELRAEMRNEQIFSRVVAGGKFRSVHPICIVERKGKHYLVQLYEEGAPLALSQDQQHFRDAMRFAARSDALMPLEHLCSKEYDPLTHFEYRIMESDLPEDVKFLFIDNCGFMFKYPKAFPLVFDGDWRPDANCLFNGEGHIIALDKEDKGVSIGPVTTARVLNQGTNFTDSDEVKDSMVDEDYIQTYQDLAANGRKIEEPELVLPVAWTSTIEKAITAYCFTVDKPLQQDAAQIFLNHALHGGGRIISSRKFRKFYSQEEREQCARIQKAIYEHLLRPRVS